MLIDWFTVGAQLVNFLILIWLMKHFLYKPILHAIDEREKRIAREIADADKKKTEAQKESDEYKRKNEIFDQERAALLNKAAAEAKAEQVRLLTEARKAADALSAKRLKALNEDEKRAFQEISSRTQNEVFSIARKALQDLADADLEERMVRVFIRRLSELDSEEKVLLVAAIKSSPSHLIIHSSFKLPPSLCALVESAIKGMSGTEAKINFETAPDLVSGIELIANGQKVSWSIADYLSSMKEDIKAVQKNKEKLVVKDGAKIDEQKSARVSP